LRNNSDDSILNHFSIITDPRRDHKKKHELIDIIAITICAVLCGADDWVSIEEFAEAKIDWFKKFLNLENGIPSHDTFGRVFAILSPEEFQESFISWVQSVSKVFNKDVIAIDGKTLRRSHDKKNGKSAIHMVSAWSVNNRMVLGQCKTAEKSNEITAIPVLLKALEIKGCIVTIDAMGCQKKIAKEINKKKGDYILGLKGNQGNLHKEAEELFLTAKKKSFKGYSVDYCETSEKSHGREETRKCWVFDNLNLSEGKGWDGLKTIGVIESDVLRDGHRSNEYRYYISSIEKDANLFLKSVREHWQIENSLHWTLDIAFREDESRARKGHSAENLGKVRHIALNLLKNEKTSKVGVKNKRLKAGWDEDYLLKVLAVANI
jgi:predicted transposase YbfD/YdcC